MSQFTRRKLTRGVKLLKEHIYTPLSGIASALSSSSIESSSVRDDDMTFRVNLWFPQINGEQMYYDNAGWAAYASPDGTRQWAVPFVLPPPQDLFDNSGLIDGNTPTLFLDEVMVSFDQRAEPAAVVGEAGGSIGKISHLAATELNIKVTILEKTMQFFNSQVSEYPDGELFSGVLTKAALTGASYRTNPFAWSNLNRQVHPYKTLIAVIDCEGLRKGFGLNKSYYLTLPSFNMSMKFRHKPLLRDMAASNIQNMPSHGGEQTADTVSITTPAANSTIEADGTGGVDAEAGVLDERLLKRLWAGYTAQGNVSGVDHINKDAGFEVIAVPMWSNNGNNGVVNAFGIDDVANAGVAPSTGKPIDERIIPLPYPMVIHHVMGVWNYCANPTLTGVTQGGRRPTSATMHARIGVGLIAGMQADTWAAQQVAYLDVTPATLSTYRVDQISLNQRQELTDRTVLDTMFDLFAIPLVQDGGTMGNGYVPTGTPMWASKGDSNVETRSTAGNYLNVSGNPPTGGAEQYLMVRWELEDANGLSSFGGGAAANFNEMYAGIGGNWVFIIGKKCVAGGREPVMSAGR